MLKSTDLQKKSEKDLLGLLAEKKALLRSLNFSLSKSKPGEDSPSTVKKDIARILTALVMVRKESK